MRSSRQLAVKTGRGVAMVMTVILVLAGLTGAPARAAVAPAPAWTITSTSSPTNFASGQPDFYNLLVANSGGVASNGSPITITDALPVGVALAPGGHDFVEFGASRFRGGPDDSQSTCEPGPPVTCTIVHTVVRPGEAVRMIVPVSVEPGASGTLVNHPSVSGGGAPGAVASESTPVSSALAPFAFQSLTSTIGDSSGAVETRAGAHPYRIQLGFQLQTNVVGGRGTPGASPRTVRTVLPPGLVVDPNATPVRCTEAQFTEEECPVASAVGVAQITTGLRVDSEGGATSALYNMVPPHGAAAELAFDTAGLNFPVHLLGGVDAEGNYVLSADTGELLAYGNGSGAVVELWGNPSDPSHDGNRGEECILSNIDFNGVLTSCPVQSSNIPFLTMPSACSGPLATDFTAESWQEPGRPISASVITTDPGGNPVGVGGCGKLEFHPTLEAQPDSSAPDSPTGLQVNLHLPQTNQISPIEGSYPPGDELQQFSTQFTSGEFSLGFEGQSTAFLPAGATAAEVQTALEGLSTIGAGNVSVGKEVRVGVPTRYPVEFIGALGDRNVPQMQYVLKNVSGVEVASVVTLTEGHSATDTGLLGSEAALSTATLKDLSVTLPKGLVVNPSAAGGQGACSEAQIGYLGVREGRDTFSATAPACPDDSKLGSVALTTPLLDHVLPGSIYLAKQDENPFGSLIALYVVVNDPVSGVIVKLPGRISLDQGTGQLTATFQQNPQLPFEELTTEFFGGPRAALTTPSTCGSYTTTSDMTPWSSPEGADAYPSDSFEVGGSCPKNEGEEPNAPRFEAGTVTPLGGSYSPFVLKLSREDGSQRFGALNLTLPQGLIGRIAGTEECSDAQLAQAVARSHPGEGALEQSNPSCPQSSEVGSVTVGAGSGSPTFVGGHAYLAGPYDGAPLSLAIVTPAVAGPFDLGTVVVRAALYIDPNTAQVTVRSDPFPTILQGIPLDLRSIAVTIDKPQFMLNPTSCEAMSISGQETSTVGQTVGLSNRFQDGGCQGLPFKPAMTISTQGKTSKANGASLTVKVVPHPGEANIHKVDLTLPKALPARLTTLQQACTEAQFNTNPAGCPTGSFIGTAKAITPLLDVPLTGPAILVSHGGAAFPDVVFLLQANERGGLIRIDLDGKTDIKKGITYSRFETVPDAPITSFETVLPEGPHSVLAANGNLCTTKLTIPTELMGQNGARINQNTAVAVTGCAKTKVLTRAQKLALALKACHKKHNKAKRQTCERQARKKYGPLKKKKTKKK
jgi:hypothetical protein